MKIKKLLLLFFLIVNKINAQYSSEVVSISETYSSNGKFKLQSISYDNEFPNLKGRSFVTYTQEYDSIGIRKKFYQINRSFDLYDGYPFFAAISNDGRKIMYIINEVYNKGAEETNVTYYVDGKLQKTYKTEEFINCNKDQEKCEMFFNNQNQIFTGSSSTIYQFKDSVTEKDKFLNKNFVFNKNDTIYVIDSRKKVTLYDLNNGVFVNTKLDFDELYPKIKNIEAIKSKVSYYKYPYKYVIDIENSKSKEKLSESISKISGLKFISFNDSTFRKYKLYRIELTGYLDRSGKFEIDKFNPDIKFNKEEIEKYLSNTLFNTDFIPREVDKIHLKYFFGGYRNFDDKVAEEETIKDEERKKEEFKKRLTLEKIDDFYIPKDLYECMTELDRILNYESKKQLKEAKDIWQFNGHMGGLGMWIRNNWGLNGGSRLQKYFKDRNIGKEMFGNDEISGVIIEQYIKWLKGDKKSWEKWVKENPKR